MYSNMKAIDLQKVSRKTYLSCSDHFKLSEFLHTDTGLVNDDIDSLIFSNLCILSQLVLEPLRSYLGSVPINISSGYRSESVNNAVGGVSNSYHRFGLAVDLITHNIADDMISFLNIQKDYLQTRGLNLRYKNYEDRNFIHIQLSNLQ